MSDVGQDADVQAAENCVRLVRENGQRRIEELQREVARQVAHEEQRLASARERAARSSIDA